MRRGIKAAGAALLAAGAAAIGVAAAPKVSRPMPEAPDLSDLRITKFPTHPEIPPKDLAASFAAKIKAAAEENDAEKVYDLLYQTIGDREFTKLIMQNRLTREALRIAAAKANTQILATLIVEAPELALDKEALYSAAESGNEVAVLTFLYGTDGDEKRVEKVRKNLAEYTGPNAEKVKKLFPKPSVSSATAETLKEENLHRHK